MSFDIKLQKISCERERVDKEDYITTVTTLTGELKQETSIVNPVIIFDIAMADIVNCNYMYINQFDRHYFITDMVSKGYHRVEVHAHVDVLHTYRASIRGNRAIIRKQENKWNLYVNDGSFKIEQDPMISTKSFPSGFSTPEFVLAIAGS